MVPCGENQPGGGPDWAVLRPFVAALYCPPGSHATEGEAMAEAGKRGKSDEELARSIEREVWERRAARELAASRRAGEALDYAERVPGGDSNAHQRSGGFGRLQVAALVLGLLLLVASVALVAGAVGASYGARQAITQPNVAPSATTRPYQYLIDAGATHEAGRRQQEREEDLLQRACESQGGRWNSLFDRCEKRASWP